MIRFAWSFLVVLCLGCSSTSERNKKDDNSTDKFTEYLLDQEPTGVRSVIDVRKEAKSGDSVVVVGQIGGQRKPFTDGRATFLLVDLSLEPCEGEGPCAWDFCTCADELPGARVLVEIVDEAGKTLNHGAREAFGVKELSQVVVKGKVSKDDKGNVTIQGTKLFIRKS